jgi:Rieske Fe-S protein
MNRRESLKTLAVTTATLSLGGVVGAQTAPKPVSVATLGKLTKVNDSLTFEFDGDPALLVRVAAPKTASPRVLEVTVGKEKRYFTAFTLICTHLGCQPKYANAALECPCHGSRFDTYGAPTRGPAKEALEALKLEVRQGVLTAVSRLA